MTLISEFSTTYPKLSERDIFWLLNKRTTKAQFKSGRFKRRNL